ncbi:MAG TPA: chemotaxis response regulator protein-glutamate methylesterase [Spirochaetia bacterium]|nr:MAG: hypothetical protein A2Y41_08160 [Spirochaetes bacterium GWB1_36_13]HCL56914.1 chemotaxis response regulator protein-glutamate methylesterase [Spirochaetia bacterium]
MPIKVMIIDDSAVVRKLLSDVLSSDEEIEVIASAANPLLAIRKLEEGALPDVLTLDVEMPEMDGITFLEQVLPRYQIPVIMFSSLTEKGAEITIDAMRKGAFDFVAKPKTGLFTAMDYLKEELVPKIKAAYQMKGRKHFFTPGYYLSQISESSQSFSRITSKVVFIGSSTGGIQALESVITKLPKDFPSVLIVQHMPPKFTKNFADRLNGISKMRIKEAENGEKIQKGWVYIAPGDFHMELKDKTTLYIHQNEKVNRHRPSVDPLFYSAAKFYGKEGVGVILTGMGSDGAQGMKAMSDTGAFTIAQDEKTCVVFGMPKEAIKLGGVSKTLPIQKIADELIKAV